jgi:hypothetical protein
LGCRAQKTSTLIIETNTRLYDSEGKVNDKEKAFKGGAASLLRILPGKMLVESNALVVDETPEPPEGAPRAEPGPRAFRRSTSVKLFDFEAGSVWTSADGSPFEPSGLDEIVYNEANQLRRSQLDFVAAYLLLPPVRSLPDVGLYSGDLRVVESEKDESFAGKAARRKKIAAEAGSVWEALVSSDASLFPGRSEREYYLVGTLGISPARAKQLLQRAGGVPVTVSIWPVVDAGGLPVAESALIRYETVLEAAPWKGPSDLEVEQARRRDEKLKDPRALIEALRKKIEEEDASPPSKVGLFLMLSARMRAEHLPDVLRLMKSAEEPFSQVELARAALRIDAKAAWPGLRAVLLGTEGSRAMNVAEALIAEGNGKALASVFYILQKRLVYTDVERDGVASWGVRHVAVLARASLDELRARASLAGGDEGRDPGMLIAAELDYWLRWWEKAKANYPPL